MVRAAVSFFIIAIVAYIFGAYGIAGLSADIGKILLGVFLFMAVLSYAVALFSHRGSSSSNRMR